MISNEVKATILDIAWEMTKTKHNTAVIGTKTMTDDVLKLFNEIYTEVEKNPFLNNQV
jgi:hypothetical protein